MLSLSLRAFYCMIYRNLITFSCIFVLVRISPYQHVYQSAYGCLWHDVKLFFVLDSVPLCWSASCALVWEISSRKLSQRSGLPPSSPASHFLVHLPLCRSLYQHHQHWHGLWRKQRTTSCRFHRLFDTLHFSSAVSSFQMRGDGSVFTERTELHLALIRGSKCFCMDFFIFQQTSFIIRF